MSRSIPPAFSYQIVQWGIWWWVLLAVVVCISLKFPVFLLFVLLLAWRAGELWFLWRMLSPVGGPADRHPPL